MKTINVILASLAVSTALLVGCKKELDKTPQITYQVRTTMPSSTIMARTMNGSVVWTSGYASTAEIEFEAAKAGFEVEFKSEVKKKIDLFSPLTSLGIVSVPAGTYDDIEFEVEIQPNGMDAALHLNGSYTNNNNETYPVSLTVNTALEIESKKDYISIVDGSSLTALSSLNLSLITTGVSQSMLNTATLTNGTIVISATSNPDIYNIILNNLRMCGGVEVD